MEIVFKKDKSNKPNPVKELFKKVVKKIKAFRPSNTFYYFLILAAISVGFYMFMLVQNDFSLAYGGDYTAQYIPMGYHVWDYYHEWFRTGHFTLFDPDIYLGANSFGSNSYYGLFSPFNIIIVLFPRFLVPQAMAITSIIKLSCAGLFFSLYMKYAFKVKDKVSYICGIAYAFCGWGAFYLWYNNYQDILVFFPLVLLGIEKTIQEKKPWILALGVFFLAICNYVLMVPYIICAFIYAMFRFFQSVRTRTVKDNFIVLGLGVVGFAGGLMMGALVFGPAFMATITSPKLEGTSYGDILKTYLKNKDFKNLLKTLFSWKGLGDQHGYVIKERILYPIFEFFFPSTTCRSLPMLELSDWDFDDIAVSLWCYVPMMMFLMPALIQSGKEKKWSHYIAFAFILLSLFTPFMYYVTMGFTNGYARWTLFIVTSLIAYVGIYLDKIPNVSRWHIHVGFAFVVIGIITSWILSYKVEGNIVMVTRNGELSETSRKFTHRFIENGTDYTSIAFIIELMYVTGVYLTLFFFHKKEKLFVLLTTIFVAVEAIAVGNFMTEGHGYDTTHNNGYAANERFKNVLNKIEKTDKSFYRMFTSIGDGWSTNNSLMNGYGAASYFHSLYNFEVDQFTQWTGLRSDSKAVGGTYRGKYQDLDRLMGVKYYVISKAKSMYYDIERNNKDGYMANVPFGFEESFGRDDDKCEYIVYKNEKLNGFGYAYDTIWDGVLTPNRSSIGVIKNAISLNEQAIVSPEDAKEIKKNASDILLAEEEKQVTSVTNLYKSIHYNHNIYNLGDTAKFYNFANIPSIPNNFEATTEYDTNDAMKYISFYTSRTEGEPLFSAGTSLYAYAPFSGSRKYNFYFIDMDNKVFMMDAHDDDTTDNSCMMRGFYIKKDVKAIAVIGKYFESYIDDNHIRLYKESKDAYDLRMQYLNANPITDVKYSADKFTFKTNFNVNRFVVSHVAFDAGWKLKATDNQTKKTTNIKLYKGNGAFVSFVAPKGDYSYTLIYETPYLNLSYFVSTVSFMTFFTSMLAYHLYQEKKRARHIDNLFREN